MSAIVTLKIGTPDHQALVALVKYQAGHITGDEFVTLLKCQGRTVRPDNPERAAVELADYLSSVIL